MLRAYGPKKPPIDLLQSQLCFETQHEAESFTAAAGFTFKTDDRGVVLRHRRPDWKDEIKKWTGSKVVTRKGPRAWIVKNGSTEI